MIPKIIHYCWFGGGPLPEEATRCIESWKKFCPDYEIREWNESNFDISACTYAKEAYEAKKWAFVSDYARFDILYNYGGLYFDTDVELIKNVDDIVERGPFIGSETYGSSRYRVAAGLGIGTERNQLIIKEFLDYYRSIHFRGTHGLYNDETVVTYITKILSSYGYERKNMLQEVAGITVYPPSYFCPLNAATGELHICPETRSIHWYSASWKDEREVDIQKKAIMLYVKCPNIIGRITSDVYKNTTKILYYAKKEGIVNVLHRIVRSIKRM